MVIDEAHCIDKWGDAFRPSYRILGDVRRKLGNPPVLAFTATAGPQTRERILKALRIPDATVILHDVDRPNIALLRLDPASDDERYGIIGDYVTELRRGAGGKALIFTPTIKKGMEIETALKARGIEAPFFHAKLRPKDRDYLQGRFDGRLSPPLDLMICTSAFGMGIDIPDIRIVFHWQHPASVEDYLQEFGRAGRDGKPSLAVLFRNRDDPKLLHWMLDKSLESAGLEAVEHEQVRKVKAQAIDEMNDIANAPGCFRSRVRNAIGSAEKRRITFAMRVLEWVFGERNRSSGAWYCCDACAKKKSFRDKRQWGLDAIRRMRV